MAQDIVEEGQCFQNMEMRLTLAEVAKILVFFSERSVQPCG